MFLEEIFAPNEKAVCGWSHINWMKDPVYLTRDAESLTLYTLI